MSFSPSVATHSLVAVALSSIVPLLSGVLENKEKDPKEV